MYIKHLHIAAFGPVTDADFSFKNSLNVIEGENESGKSAVAMFIKFIFYGLSAKAADGADLPEKRKYINWEKGYAAGYAVCVIEDGGMKKEIRVERTLTSRIASDGKIKYDEKIAVLDNETSMPIKITTSPGEFFFGVPEAVFKSSAFSSQSGDVRPDSTAVGESIENIINSADENISIKKAVDILEKGRKKLMHRNRTGGEICELERERDRLEKNLEESAEELARLRKTGSSLTDTSAKLDAAREREKEIRELSLAVETFETAKKFENIHKTEQDIADLKEKIRFEAKSGADESFTSKLTISIRDLDRYEKLKGEYTEKYNERDIFEEHDDSGVTAEGAALKKSGGILFNTGTVLLIIGLLGIIGSAALYLMKHSMFVPAAIVTALLAISGCVTMALGVRKSSALSKLLEKYDAADLEELAEIVSDDNHAQRELEGLRAALDAAENAALEAVATLDTLSQTAGLRDTAKNLSPADTAKLLAEYVKEHIAARRRAESDSAQLEGRLGEMRSSLAGINEAELKNEVLRLAQTDAGRRAENMNQSEIDGIVRERDFLKQKIEMLAGRKTDLERDFAVLSATNPSPAETAEKLAAIDEKLSRLRRSHSAYIMALEAIEASCDSVRSSVIPRITKGASEIMSKLTGGKYSELGLSPDFGMSFRTNNFGTRELDFMSDGTRDAAYISLRLALIKAIFEKDSVPPVIFDESFAYMDKNRVRSAIEALKSADMQIFLFTCRELEGTLAKDSSAICRMPSPKAV